MTRELKMSHRPVRPSEQLAFERSRLQQTVLERIDHSVDTLLRAMSKVCTVKIDASYNEPSRSWSYRVRCYDKRRAVYSMKLRDKSGEHIDFAGPTLIAALIRAWCGHHDRGGVGAHDCTIGIDVWKETFAEDPDARSAANRKRGAQ